MRPQDVVFSSALRKSFGAATLLGLAGGGAALWIVRELHPSQSSRAALPAFALGGGALAVPAVAGGVLLHWMTEHFEQQHALANVRPLLGPLPLPLGGAAIDARFADLLVRTVLRQRPRLVVECGSGSSTVLAAACLREIGTGKIVSIEHDARYAEQTRDLLRERQLDSWAEVVTAPLRDYRIGRHTMPWYSVDLERFPPAGIDLLIVDGPPRGVGRRARYPAVPLLRRALAPSCVLLMDDGNRPDERRIARRWAADLGASLEHVRSRKGAWILRRPGSAVSL